MALFDIDEDLVERVWVLARPKPFEQLSFSQALRRILPRERAKSDGAQDQSWINTLLAEAKAHSDRNFAKKAPSPSAADWAMVIPELRSARTDSWKAICDALRIDTAGDSARRKLKAWVTVNRPTWPPVPDPGDAAEPDSDPGESA